MCTDPPAGNRQIASLVLLCALSGGCRVPTSHHAVLQVVAPVMVGEVCIWAGRAAALVHPTHTSTPSLCSRPCQQWAGGRTDSKFLPEPGSLRSRAWRTPLSKVLCRAAHGPSSALQPADAQQQNESALTWISIKNRSQDTRLGRGERLSS